MKIAVIGSGIAGNVAAYHLRREHDITVFEAASHIGGHTHTHDIEHDGQTVAVDTGFIVCNDRNYPNFLALMSELGVELQPSEMSFSVQTSTGLEYNGTTLNSLFAQRRNLLRPGFWRMIRDILRFNREAPRLLDSPDDSLRLGDYLDAHDYSPQFVEHYILPMGAAIWSAGTNSVRDFPARYFVRFFHNHGMLTVDDRPQWRTVRGGSARYVEKLTAGFRDRIRLRTPVESVRRSAAGVFVKPRGGEAERFDRVFFACHSDQALRLLTDASALERAVLGAIRYQRNDVVLHTDTSVLPKRELAWAAWNYHQHAADRVGRHVSHEHPAAHPEPHAAAGHVEHAGSHRRTARDPRDELRTSRVHARGRGRAGTPCADRRPRPRVFLRCVLGLRLSRRRRRERARRTGTLPTGRTCTARSTPDGLVIGASRRACISSATGCS